MESASLVVDLINSVASVAETLPQLLRKVSEWNLLQNDVPVAIENFRTDVKYIQNCLTALKNDISLLEKDFGERLNFKKLCIDADYCSDKLKELENHLTNIHMRTQKRCLCFPSTRVTRLEDLGDRKTTLITDINSLIESINTLKAEYDELEKSYIHMAPLPEPNLLFNFENQSPEKTILDETLKTESSPLAIGAVARGGTQTLLGPGGVGKTQTICHIAHRRDVRERFPDGIFFIRLGSEANAQYLISQIAHMTAKAGSDSEAEIIRNLRSIETAVEQASEAFKHRCCLVVFDDLWSVNGIPFNIIEVLVQLVRHPDGKVVYTTRDAKLYGGKQIFFGHRTEKESEAILLAHSGLQKPDSKVQLQHFNSIIKLCNGLPVALALAGKSVRSLAARRDSAEKSQAWLDYNIDWEDEHVTAMNKVLLKAIDVMSIDGIEYAKYFQSLCVIQKAEQVPVSILSRVWSVPEKRAEKLVDNLFRFSIIRIDYEMYGAERVRTIGLHDLILDICREEARSSKIFFSAHFTLIASYKPGDKSMSEGGETSGKPENKLSESIDAAVQVIDSFRNWWFSVSDDSYIYRNIVRLLKACQRSDDIIWLLNKPKWIVVQFERNGVQMVRSDIFSAIDAVQHSSLRDDWKVVMVRWLETISTALTESLIQIQLAKWSGMIWTQLYGRVQAFKPRDIWVDTFLSEIENQAPRPWIKPDEKVFNRPSNNLKESFMLNGRYVCHTEITGGIMFLTNNGDQLYLCQFKYGNDQLSYQAIVKAEGDDVFTFGLFNKDGSEIFILTWDNRLIHLKRNSQDKAPREAHWINVQHIEKVRSIVSNWSALNFDFGDGCGEMKSIDLSETGTALVIMFTRKIGVFNLINGKWASHFFNCDSELPHDLFTCAVNGDGSVIVSSDLSGGAHVWSLSNSQWKHDTLTCVKTEFEKQSRGVTLMRLSTDGNRIVTRGYGTEVRVFEKKIYNSLNGWKQIHVGQHNNCIYSVAIRGDGNQLVCLLFDGSLHLWTYSNFEWNESFIGRHNDINNEMVTVDFLGSQNKILSVSDVNVVCVWDLKEQSWIEDNRIVEEEHLITCTSKHGKRFVSLFFNKNQETKFIRVVDKVEESCGTWIKEDIEVSDDVFELFLVEEEEEEHIVSVGTKEQCLLWVNGSGGWTAKTLRVERIELQVMQPSAPRVFIGVNDSELFFLTKSELIWKVEVFALPTIFMTFDNIADENSIVGLFNGKSRKWNGFQIDESELRNFLIFDVAVSPGRNQILFPCANVIYLVHHDGDRWEDEILEGHQNLVASVAMTSDGMRIVSSTVNMEEFLVWTKSENGWRHENVSVHYKVQDNHYRAALSIAKRIVSIPWNVGTHNEECFLMKTLDWAIRFYKKQSDGNWAESHLSGYLPNNFLEIMDSKWYKEEQVDDGLNRSIKLILSERPFYRLSTRVLFHHIKSANSAIMCTLDVLMN